MRGLFWTALIALIVLCVLCPTCRAPGIEADVRTAAAACADQAGVSADQVQVSGRDVTLIGNVATEQVRAELASCIASFRGTRAVHDRFELVTSGALDFATGYDEITIAGVVPSPQSKAAILEHAVSLWGVDRVHDDIVVDPGRTIGAWADDSFEAFLSALHHSRRDLVIELTQGRATVSGTVLSELARRRVVGAAAATLPAFEIVDRLTVREPSAAHETLQANLDALLDGKVVEFATDSAELTPAGRKVLDDVASILKRLPGRVEISGHTDSTGNDAHNLELSGRRAESAARYLVSRGIDAARLTTVGYGATRPVASNATDEGKQANRRTELHALKES